MIYTSYMLESSSSSFYTCLYILGKIPHPSIVLLIHINKSLFLIKKKGKQTIKSWAIWPKVFCPHWLNSSTIKEVILMCALWLVTGCSIAWSFMCLKDAYLDKIDSILSHYNVLVFHSYLFISSACTQYLNFFLYTLISPSCPLLWKWSR